MKNTLKLLQFLTENYPPQKGQAHGVVLLKGSLTVALRDQNGESSHSFVLDDKDLEKDPELIGKVILAMLRQKTEGVENNG